ncbi:hypothetical protein [Streptomyces sp. NPDC002078]
MHAVRHYFLDTLTPQQAAAFRAWSGQMIDRVESRCSETTDDDAQ